MFDFEIRPWYVPLEFKIDGEWLDWNQSGEHETIRVGPRLLGQFIDLSNRGDAALIRFVRTWGLLDLCDLGLPILHSEDLMGCRHGKNDSRAGGCTAIPSPKPFGWRRIRTQDMRRYAAHAKALLFTDRRRRNLEAPLLRPEEMLFSEWRDRRLLATHPAYQRSKKDREALEGKLSQRANGARAVARDLQMWLSLSSINVEVESVRDRLGACLGGGELFDAITSQLFCAILGIRGVAFCVLHGLWEVPKKPVTTGYRFFCEEGVAKKDAKLVSRKRKDRDQDE